MLRERFTTRKTKAKSSPKNPRRAPRAVPQSLMLRTGFLLSRSAQFMRESMDRALASRGITCRHYGILAVLHDEGSQTQQELGEMLLIDRSTIVDLVDLLEKKTWVKRVPDPRDRRAYQITLTPQGQSNYKTQRAKLIAIEGKFLSGISSGDLQQFQETLTRIFLHLVNLRDLAEHRD